MKLQKLLSVIFILLCTTLTASAEKYVTPADSGIYRIINLKYNLALAQDFTNGGMICDAIGDESDCIQLWQLCKKGTGWTLQNLYTGDYVKAAGSFYKQVMTSTTPATYYLKENSVMSKSYNMWVNTSQDYSLHCDNDNNIVPWYKGSDGVSASEWGFVKVEVTDSVIEAARAKYQTYKNIMNNNVEYYKGYMQYFADAACTTLKPEYASLSDDELRTSMSAYGEELTDIALKIKNDSWKEYEKWFRVHTYEPYSDVDEWAKRLQMTTYSYLSNPTGIYANACDLLYVFVGNDIPENATLQIDRVYMNAVSGVRSELKKGMNIVPVGRDNSMLYILYTADTTGDKLLADYDSLDIHIEGGILNGYWDRDYHTDADWVKITKKLATYKYIQVKGHKVMLNMDKATLTASNCVPEKITECIGWWDTMTEWQHELMGFKLDGTLERFNNLHVARTRDDANTMSSGAYNTNYPPHTLASIMSYENMMNGCNFWGPAHELGHANQKAICMIGTTEISNNLFSNMVLYKFGRYMSRGGIISETSTNYENKVPFTGQLNVNIMHTTRMFWQLYFYYHVIGNNPEFFPHLFIELRKDPLKKSTSSLNYGKDDLLKFVEKCCEVAQEDLTTFFDAWGFFVPMNRLEINDYGSYTITSTQAMIDATKEKISKYTKKCGALEFLEDRIAHYPRTDGIEGNRLAIDYKVGEAGDLGQFTAFLPDSIDTKAAGYIYSKFGKKVTFTKGSGAVGFRFYSTEDSLLTFCNTFEYMLPANIASRELKIMAVSADGSESEVTSVYNGSEEEQLEALNSALTLAQQYTKRKDVTGKKVGYYHAYAVEKLTEYYNTAKEAVDNNDQSTRTYGEWAKLLADEFENILNDPRAIIKINKKNFYKFTNAKYMKYTAYCKDNGTLACAMTSAASTRMQFVPIANSDLYYIKANNGKYINYVAQSKDITATASSTSSAAKFKVYDLGNCKYEIQKENTSYGYLHCASTYQLVGWSGDQAPSQWTITCVEDVQATEDKAALKETIDEAQTLLDIIVDTSKTTDGNIVLYSYVEATDSKLAEYVSALVAELATANQMYINSPAVLMPEETEKLTAAIALVKASYSIPTNIQEITFDSIDGTKIIYDIRGRRVSEVVPGGLYIIDGIKYRISNK